MGCQIYLSSGVQPRDNDRGHPQVGGGPYKSYRHASSTCHEVGQSPGERKSNTANAMLPNQLIKSVRQSQWKHYVATKITFKRVHTGALFQRVSALHTARQFKVRRLMACLLPLQLTENRELSNVACNKTCGENTAV